MIQILIYQCQGIENLFVYLIRDSPHGNSNGPNNEGAISHDTTVVTMSASAASLSYYILVQ
jgi:hypothetical protein